MTTFQFLRRLLIILVGTLVICLTTTGGNVRAAQDVPSLPGQFAYVEGGSRLMLVRGNVNEPVLLVQTAHGSSVSNPRFSQNGRYMAYCIHDPTAEDVPALYYLDALSLEKFLVTTEGSCSYDWSPDGTSLVYATPAFIDVEMHGQPGLFSFSPETGSIELLIPTDSPIIEPRFSPDGGTLSFFDFCFECVGQFYTYDLATKEIREWSTAGTDRYIGPDMDWSPDGRSLVFDKEIWVYASAGESYGLELASLDGGTWHEIHSMPGRAAHFPIWSADGKQIAFASFESFAIGTYLNRRADLMTVDPDGSETKTLYSSIYEIYPQAWSPDGRYLLVVEPLSVSGDPLQKQQLVLLDAGTGSVVWMIESLDAVTADWAPFPTAPVSAAPPSTQMAGKDGLLFVSTDYALSFYEPVSGQVHKLTAPFSGQDMSLSPDGKTVLFGDQIVTVASQADGSISATILESPHPQFFYNINWSADSRKYGFVDEDGGAWMVDLPGSRTQLADGDSPPVWSHDGRWMAYCDREGRLWIAESGKPADWIIQRENCSVQWSPTQSILAYVTYPDPDFENYAQGTAFLFDPISGRTREVAQAVSEVGWSADGKLLSLQRITWMGASSFGYTISVVNPETGLELAIDEFEADMYGNKDWIEQADGYLLGKYHFQADLTTSEQVAELLFDATRDGSLILVGSGGMEGLEVGCIEVAGNAYHPIASLVLHDLPGMGARFSPDGEWVLVSNDELDRTASWLGRCGPEPAVRFETQALPYNQYFSPDSAWLVMEETYSFQEPIARISLRELETGAVRQVQAALNTSTAWFRTPEQPVLPSLAPGEETLPEAGPAGGSGPINLQSDTPNAGGRSSVVPLLLWAGALVAVVVLAYLLWRRNQAATRPEAVIGPAAQAQAEVKPVHVPASAPQIPPEDVDSAFRQGVELVRAGSTAEGRVELGKVVAARPEDEDAWFWLAIASVKEKSYRSAERCFLQAKKHGHPEADKALEWLKKQRA